VSVDALANRLLDEAKRFNEKAKAEKDSPGKEAYLHASLLLACCSLEAHVNSIADDFLVRQELPILQKAILAEREYRFEDGEFVLTDILKMWRLTDRMEFLFRRFSGAPLDKQEPWWGHLKAALNLRNDLAHAKQNILVSEIAVEQALKAVVDALDTLYRAVYRKPFPTAKRGLNSKMNF
jgi:hypothetical protein